MNVTKRKVGTTTIILQSSYNPSLHWISLGTVLGTCIDGFLFGACCRLPELGQDGDEAFEEEEEEVEVEVESQLEEDKLDLTVNTEPAGVNEKPPILLSDLLSKSDLSDLDLDDITINPTEASHDDLKEPDVLDSLGEHNYKPYIKHEKKENTFFKAKNISTFLVNVYSYNYH